jgi:Icc-related predicted phosphoesterase
MPRFAVIGDVHAHMQHLGAVLRAARADGVDGVLLVGDLGSHDVDLKRHRTVAGDARYLASVEAVLAAVAELGVPYAYVPGNHDLPDLAFAGNADRGVIDVGGVRVAGIGGAGPARFGFSYEWSEDEIRGRRVPDAAILLVHCPPLGTPLDLVARHEHVGSEAIRELATRRGGILVCGHIHEAPSACLLGDCLCLNVGGLGRPFGRPQVGFIDLGPEEAVEHLDLETGVRRRWTRDALREG